MHKNSIVPTPLSLAFILVGGFLLMSSSVLSQETEVWRKVGNGLEYRMAHLDPGARLGKKLFVSRMTPGRHTVKVLRAQDFGKKAMTAKEICIASGALLCINASFFDEKEAALGLLISSGITFQKPHMGGDTLSGIFASARKSFTIVGREDFNSALFIEAIQAGPRLVKDSQLLSNLSDQEGSRRSGLCLDQNGVPLFFVSALDSWPLKLSEFGKAMRNPEFDCKDGLNLDGGGSSQFFMRSASGKTLATSEELFDIKGQEEAPVFLGVVEGLRF